MNIYLPYPLQPLSLLDFIKVLTMQMIDFINTFIVSPKVLVKPAAKVKKGRVDRYRWADIVLKDRDGVIHTFNNVTEASDKLRISKVSLASIINGRTKRAPSGITLVSAVKHPY